MKRNLTLMAIAFLVMAAKGQCPSGNIIFSTQAEIDAFPTDYPGCTDIEGDITISGSDITDLNGFISLNSISNGLTIQDNPILENLSGLENLISTDFLAIVNNPSLTSLAGIWLQGAIYNSLGIVGNDQLLDLSGLENITHTGYLIISSNQSLISLNGLNNLNSTSFLTIKDNPVLPNLNGIESLMTVGLDILIQGNLALTDITGLGNLTDFTFIDIYDNPQLSNCAIQAVCNSVGGVIINNNAPGCNTVEEIEISCLSGLSTLAGSVTVDLNCDDMIDIFDTKVPSHLIAFSPGLLPFAMTNQAGDYLRYLQQNTTFVFSAIPPPGYSVQPTSHSVTTDGTIQTYSGLDFRLCPDSLFHNLSVSLAGFSPPRPGFLHQYQVCAENQGTYPEDALLTFDFSNVPSGNYTTILDAEGGDISGQSVTWNLSDLPLFSPQCFNITVEISAATPLGTVLFPHAVVSSATGMTEITLNDNTSTFEQEVVGSFDPNDKTVNQPEVIFSENGDPVRLEYQIRFQNTGNFPATFVEVLDTLESNLDIRTIQMITASHPYTLSFPADNILKWRFDNINLPDSTSNEPESHGFILFSIATIPELSLTETVRNTAAIYFDYNEPVITNTATTNFYTSIAEANPPPQLQLSAVPNPTSDKTWIRYALNEPADCQIIVSNGWGAIIQTHSTGRQTAGANIYPLDFSGLSAGVYIVQIIAGKEMGGVKVVVEK